MKIIILSISFFFSVAAQAQLLGLKEFSKMTVTQQELVLIEYKNFLAQYPMPLETKSDAVTKLDFISFLKEAHAAGDYNCFFAGWPSKSVRVGTRSVCSSPSKTNSDYQAQASKCTSGSMLCQPILFGDVGCIQASTPKQKSLAFSSCESKFKASGKSLADVVAGLTDATKAAAAEEVFGLVARVCSTGVQATKPMCHSLKNKVEAIKKIKPAVANPTVPTTGATVPTRPEGTTGTPGAATTGTTTTGSDITAAGTLAATTLTRPVVPAVDCDPAASQPGGVSAAGDPILAICGRPNPDTLSIPKSMAELLPILEQYGVQIAQGQTPAIEDIRKFVAELKRFPSDLYESGKSRGARILLLVGSGVTADPNFRPTQSPTSNGTVERSWSTLPGVGGAIYSRPPVPTRIVVNHLYDGHGSRSLVMHEHMHTLDFMFMTNGFSQSQAWTALRSNDKMIKLMDTLDKGTTQPHYCKDNPEESLAEMFAYYHGCQQAKDQVKAYLHEIATYLDNFSVDSACTAEPARCPRK
jgi:hypothetical protein